MSLPRSVAAALVAALALAPTAAEARRRVFYCGSVRYEAQELGTYQLDDRSPGGGWTKASEQLRRSTLGTWAVCLACTGADADIPAWGCAGSGLGDLAHSFLRSLRGGRRVSPHGGGLSTLYRVFASALR